MAKLSASCVHAKFSHFYLGIFSSKFYVCLSVHWNSQKGVDYCLVITKWKCQYRLIWALKKSILFASNPLKVPVLCDMNSEKTFYNTLIWKKLWKCPYCLVWTLEKCVVLFTNNLLKMLVLFDVSSGKCVLLFASNSEKVSIVWCKLWKSV